MRFRPGVSLAACGLALGAIVVGLEGWGGIHPPRAYGFCTTCHGQDLISWAANRLAGFGWELSPAGAETPLLTVVGVLVGARLAAALAGEQQIRTARHPWLSVGAGILAAILGLLALGCPIRQLVVLGYGDWIALPALLGHVTGAVLGVLLLRWAAGRMA